MTYDPSDDFPDSPLYPSLPGHELEVGGSRGTRWEPGEVYARCTCGGWDFTSQESAGGPVEAPLPYFEDHLTAVQCGEIA